MKGNSIAIYTFVKTGALFGLASKKLQTMEIRFPVALKKLSITFRSNISLLLSFQFWFLQGLLPSKCF